MVEGGGGCGSTTRARLDRNRLSGFGSGGFAGARRTGRLTDVHIADTEIRFTIHEPTNYTFTASLIAFATAVKSVPSVDVSTNRAASCTSAFCASTTPSRAARRSL